MAREAMRAGDSDRQRVADQLRAALNEGRLDLHEYDERLQRTYLAKTYGDLDGLLDDLPGTVPPAQSRVAPVASASPAATSGAPVGERHDGALRWTRYVGIFVVCTLVWLFTSIGAGHLHYFWPMWVAVPVVLGIVRELSHPAGGPGRDARRAARRARRRR